MPSRIKKVALAAGLLLSPGLRATAQITSLPPHPAAAAVSAAEYFFDTDPGFGNGLPVGTGSGTDISAVHAIPVGALSPGPHRLFIRSHNDAGSWSLTHSEVFVIYSLFQALPQTVDGPAVVAAEYFVDTDPGAGNGIPVALPGPGADLTAAAVPVDVSGLPLGIHRIFFRSRSSAGSWSLSTGATFTILINTVGALPQHPAGRPVTAVEYFIDTDPGYGNGIISNVPPTADLADQTVAVDITGLTEGAHTLFVRSINGHSMTAAHSFSIGGTALPVSWLTMSVRPEGGAALVSWRLSQPANALYYQVERSADGRSFEPLGKLRAEGGATTTGYTFRDERPLAGQSYYRVRLGHAGGALYSAVLPLHRGETGAGIRIGNPVSTTLTIKRLGDGAERFDLSIRDLAGRELLHPGTGPAVQIVDVSMLPSGQYLLCWLQAGQPRVLKFTRQ